MKYCYRNKNDIDVEGGNTLCSVSLLDVTITPPRAVNDMKCGTPIERSVKTSNDLTKIVRREKHNTYISSEDNCEDGGDIASPLNIPNKIMILHNILLLTKDKISTIADIFKQITILYIILYSRNRPLLTIIRHVSMKNHV